MKRLRTDVLAIVAIIITVGVFFWPVTQGKLPVPADTLVGLYHPWRDLYANAYPRGIPYKNFLITDPIRQQIPWRKVAIDQWKSGNIPSWNPYSFSGNSLAGNIQAAAFYPFNILFAFLDFPAAWTMLIILEPLLAALFLYAYLRTKELSPLSSLFGAISWSFSGFTIAWLTWGTMIHVVLWIPLILLSIDKRRGHNVLWSIILVAALTSQLFAGHAQLSLYVLLLAGLYAVWRRANFFWIVLFISLAITSIQWFPLVRSVFESSRVLSGENWHVAGWFLPWQHLVQFLAPDFFGNPATLNYWGEWNYGEFIGYISIVSIIFALYVLLAEKKSPHIKFWGWTLTISLVFILPTPIAKLPYLLGIPILSALQPTRLMSIIDFSLVVLAAHGFSRWQESKDKRIWLPILLVGSMLVILWVITLKSNLLVSQRNLILPAAVYGLSALVIAGASNPRKKVIMASAGIVVVVIVAFDLMRFGWKFTPFTPKEYFFPQTQAIAFLQSQQKPFRVVSTDPKLLPPNVAAFYGIEDISGYDPIIALRYEELLAGIARNKPDIEPPFGFNRIVALEHANTRLFQLLGVRYILSLKDLNTEDVHLVFQEGETRIYEIMGPSPRVYFAQRYLVGTSKQKVIDSLFDPLFKPGEHAVVESEPIGVLQYFPDSFKATSSITTYSSSEIEISAQAGDFKRLLVILNRFDSGWHATIDGKSTDILRTNYIFQGIVVPPGQHTVRLAYE